MRMVALIITLALCGAVGCAGKSTTAGFNPDDPIDQLKFLKPTDEVHKMTREQQRVEVDKRRRAAVNDFMGQLINAKIHGSVTAANVDVSITIDDKKQLIPARHLFCATSLPPATIAPTVMFRRAGVVRVTFVNASEKQLYLIDEDGGCVITRKKEIDHGVI